MSESERERRDSLPPHMHVCLSFFVRARVCVYNVMGVRSLRAIKIVDVVKKQMASECLDTYYTSSLSRVADLCTPHHIARHGQSHSMCPRIVSQQYRWLLRCTCQLLLVTWQDPRLA